MSDSIAILSNSEIAEKKRLLKSIKKSAKKLRDGCVMTSNKYKFFDTDTLEMFDGFFKTANEIIELCEYEADNHISLEVIELAELYNSLRATENATKQQINF